MKQLLSVIALVLAVSVGALAHNGNEHVRGTIVEVTSRSLTVQLADKTAKTLSITPATEVEKAGKSAHLADIKAGDRVVVDVPENGTNALLIKIGVAAAKK